MHLSQRRQQVALCLILAVMLTARLPGGRLVAADALPPEGILSDEALGYSHFISGDLLTRPDLRDRPEAVARVYFASHRAVYGIGDPDAELTVRQVTTDALGMAHIRFDQVYQGVPVWGRQLVAHIAPGGRLTAVNGDYLKGIRVNRSPDLPLSEAIAQAKLDLGDAQATLRPQNTGLVIYEQEGRVWLAWQVDLHTNRPDANWSIFVDAHYGGVIQRLDTIGAAKERRTYSAGHLTDLPGLLICDESDPDCTGGDADAQSAHRHAGTVYDYFMTVHLRDSYDDAGGTFTSTVHYDSNFNHLYWDGEQMVYGDGDGVTFTGMARALDLVGHEWTHAVIDYTANLIHQDQPGALAESVADVFGTMVEFFGDADHADWLIGEDVYTPATPGDALRDMADPTQGLYDPNLPYQGPGQPDHMSHYANLPLSYDNGGIHINSGIINKAAYLIAEGGSFHGINVAGIGRSQLAQIWYRALVYYLTPLSDFTAARNAIIQAAKDLYGADSSAVKTVQDAFAAVGLGRAASQTQRLHLPLAQHNASRNSPSSGIYGRITQDGTPVENVSLTLRRCTGIGRDVFCDSQATAVTDAFGEYRFTGIPATAANQYYYVRYVNSNDSRRVAYWFGDEIARYTPDTPRQGGSADIGDVQLQAPANSATVSLPVTMRWMRRNVVPTDLYQLDFLSLSLEVRSSILSDLSSDSLSLTALPSGLTFDEPFLWGVSALNGDGVAASYFLHRVTFAASITHLDVVDQIARPTDETGLDRIHYRWMVSGL